MTLESMKPTPGSHLTRRVTGLRREEVAALAAISVGTARTSSTEDLNR